MIAERFYFHSRSQKAGESIAEFVAELHRLAAHCEFRDYLNEALRDRFVCRLLHGGIQRRLLPEASLTLAKALEIAQGMEAAEANAKRLKGDAESVHHMRPRVTQGSAAQLSVKSCYRCGGTSHFASTCRVKEAICHKCKKRGHIARACRGGRASDTKRYAANERQKTPQRRRQTLKIQKPEPQQEEQRSFKCITLTRDSQSHWNWMSKGGTLP